MKTVTREIQIERCKRAVDGIEYDARFILSAATPDRVHDTIDPKAYAGVVKKITKLIALWNHDPDHPVGYWSNLKVVGDTLTGYIKLASTNLGKMIKALLESDVPLGASISFSGKGSMNDKGGIHFTSLDLFETSLVSTPAHPRAVQIAKSFGVELQSSKQTSKTPVAMSCRYAETVRLAHQALARAKSSLPTTVKQNDIGRTDQKSTNRTGGTR